MPELLSVQTTPATPTPGYDAYAFDPAVVESLYYQFTIRKYGSGNLNLAIRWSTAATSGNAVWAAQIAAITPGDAGAVSAKTYATANTVTDAADANANRLNAATITISNLDSLATDDLVFLRFYRDAASGSDTINSNDCLVYHLDLAYSDV
ncbi:MAG: hypothetical protein JXB36_02955 [Gammaproteobacteria bacterium]|nr:hypothetical protein [Gammaproteobacteria bacterium]